MAQYQKVDYLSNFGKITGYGSPLWKPGLDVDLKKGDAVSSPKNGKVVFAGKNGGFGNQVVVEDIRGNRIMLSHLDGINVKVGDTVSAGQTVGLGGNTGSVISGKGGDGSHLDLTVKKKDGSYLTAEQAEKYVSYEPLAVNASSSSSLGDAQSIIDRIKAKVATKSASASPLPTVQKTVIDATDLDVKIDQARNLGKTDTEILEYLSGKDASVADKISQARKLRNDRDVLNYLSTRATGKMPTVASVPKSIPWTGAFPSPSIQNLPNKDALENVRNQNSKATFQEKPEDSAWTASLKLVGNMPSSALSFGKGVLNAINPIETAKRLSELPKAYKETVEATGSNKNAIIGAAKELPKATYETLTPTFIQYVAKGDYEKAREVLVESPVEQIAPMLIAGKQVANKVGKSAAFDSAMKTVTKTPLNLAKKTVTAPVKVTGEATKFGLSQMTGMNKSTVAEIIKNPSEFSKSKIANTSREGLARDVETSINKRLSELEQTGKGYEVIKKNSAPAKVNNFVDKVLKNEKYGLKIKDGKITADTNSITRSGSDLKAIQEFYDIWGNKTEFTAQEFLNMRSDLANLSKFDVMSGKTNASQTIAKAIRAESNNVIRPNFSGLKELDDAYAPEVKALRQIKKDYFTKDGNLKDGAVNKIANLTGKGKQQVLGRLEEIHPGITQKITVLKAIEDIQASSGIKVGSYTRSIVPGALILGGNFLLSGLSMLLSAPEIAIPMLRAYGKSSSAIGISARRVGEVISRIEKGDMLSGSDRSLLKDAIIFFGQSEDKKKNLLNDR